MKGLIFNYLEEFFTENYGVEAWERIFNMCPVQSQQNYLGPKTYPDSLMLGILEVISRELNTPKEVLLKTFGEFLFKKLAEDYNHFMEPYSHPKPFLQSIHSVIHVEVMKMLENATPPKFTYEDPAPNKLLMSYHSDRKFCLLMEGILEGVSKWYGMKIDYTQQTCLMKGDSCCCFEITFETAPEESLV